MRGITYLNLTRHLQFLLERTDRMSMATAVEARVPFLDHRLVEYAFNIPWSMKVFNNNEKALLRAAIADLLPTSIFSRKKSPYPMTQDPAYSLRLCEHLNFLLSSDCRSTPLMNRRAAAKLLANPGLVIHSPLLRRHIELLIGFALWNELTDVHFDITCW